MTIPVALVASVPVWHFPNVLVFNCGLCGESLLDGKLVGTDLFSEVVNLHPLVIIISVLIFGGLWGFWGRILRDSIGNARQSCDKCIAGLDRIKEIKRKLTKVSFFVLLISEYPEFRHNLLSLL